MTPDRYEISAAGRRRMQGVIKKRGTRLGMSTLGGVLFGTAFVGVGAYVLLIGTRTIHVAPSSVHAPYWVLSVFGVCFAAAGLSIWSMAGRQFAANRRRALASTRYRDEPALADYAWHPDGCEVSEWPGVVKGLVGALFVTIFLSMFNWWAFGAGGPWMVKLVVIIFDCVLVVVWGFVARQFLRALKFGHSRVEFGSFPLRLGGPIVLRWQPSRGVGTINRGAFTLRCVQEWWEVVRDGNEPRNSIVHEEIWSAQGLVEHPRNLQFNERVELRFEAPADALPTQLSADKPIFWELQAKLDLPGLNFDETYLVPVYAQK